MIRINLLPQVKRGGASGTGASQLWVILYLAAAVLWSVALMVVYISRSNTLDEKTRDNSDLEQQITRVKADTGQLDEIRARIAASRQLEGVVSDLNKARLGPTRVLMELSKILSLRGGPTIDPRKLEQLRLSNPLANVNRNWDPRRLWLTSFEEQDRNCTALGEGRTNEDVAEFLQRLQLSELFESAALISTQSVVGTDGMANIGFEMRCRVRY